MTPPNDRTSGQAKIRSIEELTDILERLRAEGRKVVHCHGVFDLLHPGHIRHLKAARAEGDLLVVTVTADRFVNKGPGRPVFNQQLRAEVLSAIEDISFVAINHEPDAVSLIRALKPNVYVKGSDYVRPEDDPTGKIHDEEQAVHAIGGRIHFTDEVTFSSSHLINQRLDVFPPETEAWLKSFRARYSLDQILSYVEAASRMKAMVIGEPIIDEYVFCNSLGKSTKDPVLAVQYRSMERHAGGTLAVANHLGGIVGSVTLVAQIGSADSEEAFMRRSLAPTVEAKFVQRSNAPTIHKRRFVDAYTSVRLLELYLMEDGAADPDDVAALDLAVRERIADHDIVVVADYGHGMMTPKVIDSVTGGARFLTVNTQANAGNRGFNTISKYRRADYVCLANHEIELETRMRQAPFRELIGAVAQRIDCPNFTVTRGRTGSIHFDRSNSYVEVPALAGTVIDRVGAGDALLAVTAPLVAMGAPWEIVGFLGNIAGGQMVADLGNRVAVNRPSLIKAITALMK